MNQAEEDYLKLIYELSNELTTPYIKTTDLADKFGYTVQSVNEMVKRLDRKKLLKFEPYKGIKLTSKGSKEAIRMTRAHRIWEVFLSDKLGLSWEALHEEAEKLEHATSEPVLEKLHEFLGYPKYCNHGNPIPNQEGIVEKVELTPLFELKAGETFTIKRVLDHKPLLKHLNTINVGLNEPLKVIKKESLGDIIYIEKANESIAIAKRIAKMIFVKKRSE